MNIGSVKPAVNVEIKMVMTSWHSSWRRQSNKFLGSCEHVTFCLTKLGFCLETLEIYFDIIWHRAQPNERDGNFFCENVMVNDSLAT